MKKNSTPEEIHILVVEDDPDINDLLGKILNKAGFMTTQAYSGTEAMLLIEAERFDLLLLDLMLPGVTGEELITQIRAEKNLSVPIIIITAKAGTSDKVSLLRLGADDYITKPFVTEEVVARVEATLRRSSSGIEESDIYNHRDLSLDGNARRVLLEGKEIQLTAHEFDLLEILIKSPDVVFSRERLYQMIWKGEYYGEDNTINVHVSNIRKKLAGKSDDEYIQTVWGIGFKLI